MSGTNAVKLDDCHIFGTSGLLVKSANFSVATRVEESGCKTKSYLKAFESNGTSWTIRYYVMVSTEPSACQVKDVFLQF